MFNVGKSIAAVLILLSFTGPAGAANDLVTKRSMHPFAETLDRLEAAARQNGLAVFARLDHAAAAKSAGLSMPPATVLVVGNPRGGNPAVPAASHAGKAIALQNNASKRER